MKKWFSKNKILLIAFGITTFLLAIITSYEVNLILNNLEDLKQYAETKVISEPLKKFGVISVFILALGGIWFIMLFTLLWKVIFPTKKTVTDAFFITDLQFLKNMPREIKKGLNKNE